MTINDAQIVDFLVLCDSFYKKGDIVIFRIKENVVVVDLDSKTIIIDIPHERFIVVAGTMWQYAEGG